MTTMNSLLPTIFSNDRPFHYLEGDSHRIRSLTTALFGLSFLLSAILLLNSTQRLSGSTDYNILTPKTGASMTRTTSSPSITSPSLELLSYQQLSKSMASDRIKAIPQSKVANTPLIDNAYSLVYQGALIQESTRERPVIFNSSMKRKRFTRGRIVRIQG